MKAIISQLMDGELERREAAGPLDALRSEGEARDTWRSYHLIGDVMRDTHLLSAGFAARVAARLAGEPTVMAPSRLARQTAQITRRPLWALSAAASMAAMALVGWLAFGPQDGPDPVPRLAQAPQQSLPAMKAAQPVQLASPVAQVPPPDAANDYLYAHQGYSPRNSLQGVAPYVRTVSGAAEAHKR